MFALTIGCRISKNKNWKTPKATEFANIAVADLSPPLSKIIEGSWNMLWRMWFSIT